MCEHFCAQNYYITTSTAINICSMKTSVPCYECLNKALEFVYFQQKTHKLCINYAPQCMFSLLVQPVLEYKVYPRFSLSYVMNVLPSL